MNVFDLEPKKRLFMSIKEYNDKLYHQNDNNAIEMLNGNLSVINKEDGEEVEETCENLCEIQIEDEMVDSYKERSLLSSKLSMPKSHSKKKRLKHPYVTAKRLARNPDGLSIKFQSDIWPVNAYEQKENFFKLGLSPKFKLKGTANGIEKMICQENGQIKFNYYYEAKRILEFSLRKFKTLDKFVLYAFGKPISINEAKEQVNSYLCRNGLTNSMNVIWSKHLICSAQMCTSKPKKKKERQYTLLIKCNHENTFIRENGIQCLLNHEIGTHFLRSFNDSKQPWTHTRQNYNITPVKSHEGMKTEEGLACVHTILDAKVKYLCMPALLYYSSCMAEYLSFKQLFDHLSRYVKNPEQRWKHCMRIKRILKRTDDVGGYGKDQRYFEGAVEILRNIENIDFNVLIRTKIIWKDIPKVASMLTKEGTQVPEFMLDYPKYLDNLRDIAHLNGLISKPYSKFVPMSRKETMRALGVTEEQVKRVSTIPPADLSKTFASCAYQYLPHINVPSTHNRPSLFNSSPSNNGRNKAGGDSPTNFPECNRQVVAKMCGCSIYSGIKYDVNLDINPNNRDELLHNPTSFFNQKNSNSALNKTANSQNPTIRLKKRQIPIIFELDMKKPIL